MKSSSAYLWFSVNVRCFFEIFPSKWVNSTRFYSIRKKGPEGGKHRRFCSLGKTGLCFPQNQKRHCGYVYRSKGLEVSFSLSTILVRERQWKAFQYPPSDIRLCLYRCSRFSSVIYLFLSILCLRLGKWKTHLQLAAELTQEFVRQMLDGEKQ